MSEPLDRRQLLCSALAAASGGLNLPERASAAGLRKPVLIERSRISGKSHSGIPILIKLTDPELRAVEQGGQVRSPAGDTLFFTADDGKTDLPHEIREYRPDSGHLEAWVRIPELHSKRDTQFYLQQRASPQGTDVQSVWDPHYKLVVHLPEGRGPVGDSSIQRNAVTRREEETGRYIVVSHSDTLSFAHELTVEAWINAHGPSTDGIQALVSQWSFQESFGKFEGYDAGNTSGLVTRGFFGAVFDGRHIYFVPQHDGVARHGKVLRYDTHQPFKSSQGWEAYDASHTSDLDTRGYYGAVFDGRHVYFIPRTDGKTYHTRFLRYDTQEGFTDPNAWQAYDIGYTHSYQSAAFDGRYIYFTPGYDAGGGSAKVLRYDTRGSFTDAGSYTRYDAGETSGLKSVNYDGAAFDGRYVYFAPLNADGIALRLDTKGPFESRVSWTAVDVPALSGHNMHMCVGAVFDGRYIYYVPYAHSVVVRLDTRGDFTSATSWSSSDAAGTSGLAARGYDGGIFDGRYVYFLPFWQGGDAKTGFHGELLRYNTQRPFESRSAWGAVDAGHTDVPAFLGLDRRQAPGWLLLAMARCGLFDEWSIRSATAVAWLYNGPGGELTYWPEGPDQQPQHHDRLWNTALVGDNDHMFHRVEGVGSPEAPAMMLSATSQLDHVGQRRFDLVDRGEVLTTFDVTELRISLSWKALVFPTEADHDRYVSRRDHLDLDRVLDILGSDLRQRGHPIAHDGGLDDPILMEAVADAYPRRVPSFQSSPGR